VAVGTGLNLPHYPQGTRLTGIDASPVIIAIAAADSVARAQEGAREVRLDARLVPGGLRLLGSAAVRDHQELDALEPLAEAEASLRACCTVHPPAGFAVTQPRCIRRVPCSMNTKTYSLLSRTVSTCRKPTARILAA
jgi:hypothetical protein